MTKDLEPINFELGVLARRLNMVVELIEKLKASQTLFIGEYTIRPYLNDFWIGHASGLGLQVSKQALEKVLSEFFEEDDCA